MNWAEVQKRTTLGRLSRQMMPYGTNTANRLIMWATREQQQAHPQATLLLPRLNHRTLRLVNQAHLPDAAHSAQGTSRTATET